MSESEPSEITWSEHAVVKAHLLGYARSDVEDLVLTRHSHRARNTGAADWLVRSGRLVVAYNFPAADGVAAHIVTLWRQA
ncbi:MAG TPA: hypothetical protein VF781_11710 [Solirubrobacteraceae bacterium]